MVRSVARYVDSPTRIPSTGAADCKRAAVLTTSPDAIPSPRAVRAPSTTNASPVVIRRRARADRGPASRRSADRSRRGSPIAARTARSGSSSCATGAPNSAITASPMNFSTVPPKCSSSVTQQRVIRHECATHVLDVHPLTLARETDQVGEQHRHDLAFLDQPRRRPTQRRRTFPAKLVRLRIFPATLRTDQHKREYDRFAAAGRGADA